MSFDVYINCKHCGSSLHEFNITHNINSIVDECLIVAAKELDLPEPKSRVADSCYAARSWGRLEGWTGHEAVPLLERALRISRMPEHQEGLRKMEPSNKWGSLESAQDCLASLHESCVRNPAGVIHASG